MSATIKQRLAKGIRWAARVIGVGGILFYLINVFVARTMGDPLSHISAVTNFQDWTIVIALVGCIISWWREWLAGILLIISWLTSLGVVRYAIVMDRPYYADDWLGFASALPVAGLLFLLSWWLSRKMTHQ